MTQLLVATTLVGLVMGMHQGNLPRVTRTGDTEITVRSRIAATPDRVFAALTTPDLLRKWMSADGRDMVESRVDLRPQGSFRYVFKSSRGSTFGMFGTYREVVPGRRIVHTEAYDGYDWPPLVTTTELTPENGGTLLVMRIQYPSKEIRDRDFPNVQSAMAEGFVTRIEQALLTPLR